MVSSVPANSFGLSLARGVLDDLMTVNLSAQCVPLHWGHLMSSQMGRPDDSESGA